MNDIFPVFLIDLDGVLLEPHGYRKAIQSTLAWFTEKMGLGDLYPGEDAIARFESISMTCEWDITPILLAAIFDGLIGENRLIKFPADIKKACAAVRTLELHPPKLNLERLVDILSANFKPGMEYATLALELSQPDAVDPLYPNLAGHALLTNILANTRLLDGALTTRVFQHFTLGSTRYQTSSQLAPFFESESYLKKFDKPLLNREVQQTLLSGWRKERFGAVVYTARPSLPVKGNVVSFNYSPEAEVALEALGLSELPLMAAGKMGWLATELKISVDQLTKPSPVQALAAITTAVTRRTEMSLWSAVHLFFDAKSKDYKEFPTLSIHVFEDSGGNIDAVRKAGEVLGNAGVQNKITAWGIAQNHAKQRALSQAGATLVPDINQAIQQAFMTEGIQE